MEVYRRFLFLSLLLTLSDLLLIDNFRVTLARGEESVTHS
jgi:hypothetical protein